MPSFLVNFQAIRDVFVNVLVVKLYVTSLVSIDERTGSAIMLLEAESACEAST